MRLEGPGRSLQLALAIVVTTSACARSAPIPRPWPPPGPGPVLGRHIAVLDSLARGASGIALVQVTRLRDEDTRSSDGDFVQIIDLRTIRSTGLSSGGFAAVRENGGFPQIEVLPDTTDLPGFYVPPDSLQLGQRYWIATANVDLHHFQGLTGLWPADSGSSLSNLFEAVIAEDAFAWRPVYWGDLFAIGCIQRPTDRAPRVRFWHRGRLVWERSLEGRLTGEYGRSLTLRDQNQHSDEYLPGFADTAKCFLAQVAMPLNARNRFGLPAGHGIVDEWLDHWTGRLIASRARVEGINGLTCFQVYARPGRLTYEFVEEWVPSGGREVGADEDHWIRNVKRWFDPTSGRIRREVITRYGARTHAEITPRVAYSVAPLKQAYRLKRR